MAQTSTGRRDGAGGNAVSWPIVLGVLFLACTFGGVVVHSKGFLSSFTTGQVKPANTDLPASAMEVKEHHKSSLAEKNTKTNEGDKCDQNAPMEGMGQDWEQTAGFCEIEKKDAKGLRGKSGSPDDWKDGPMEAIDIAAWALYKSWPNEDNFKERVKMIKTLDEVETLAANLAALEESCFAQYDNLLEAAKTGGDSVGTPAFRNALLCGIPTRKEAIIAKGMAPMNKAVKDQMDTPTIQAQIEEKKKQAEIAALKEKLESEAEALKKKLAELTN